MRAGASGSVILSLLLYSGAAEAASDPRLRLDLPPGPLAAAVAALSAKSRVSIGASDPRLLAIPLPALHLKGSPAELLASLARRAGVMAVPAGAQGWRIVSRAARAPAARGAGFDAGRGGRRAGRQAGGAPGGLSGGDRPHHRRGYRPLRRHPGYDRPDRARPDPNVHRLGRRPGEAVPARHLGQQLHG